MPGKAKGRRSSASADAASAAKLRKSAPEEKDQSSQQVEEPVENAETQRRRNHVNDKDVSAWRKINGIKEEAFIKRGHLIGQLEAFQACLPGNDLSVLRFFSGLTELSVIMQPNVTSLHGIQYCPHLLTLWVSQ